ncbi:MAG: MarR family transcriptional regulator, partial [Bacteroidales bacterium]|nr:MarR family transcriptional regulator [Bacteroidales bacterium]
SEFVIQIPAMFFLKGSKFLGKNFSLLNGEKTMIDFACKKFDLEEIVKCSLGLSKSEFRILKFLIANDNRYMTEELSDRLGLDKSTIQRGVKKLHQKGLVVRGQINQSKGGYVFYYRIKEKDQIRHIIIDIVEGWTKGVKREILNW